MSAIDWTGPFEVLEPGQRFRSRGRTITAGDLVCFAALTGEGSRQRADAAWDAAVRSRGRIAHGMLLASFAVGLLPLDPARVVALRRVHDVVLGHSVKLGQALHVEARIDTLQAIDDEVGLVGWRCEIVEDRQGPLARVGLEVLWSSRSAERRGSLYGAIGIEYPSGVLPC